MEVRNVQLKDLDFDRKQLKVVQGKGSKDRYVPLSEHLIRGLKNTSKPKNPKIISSGCLEKAEPVECLILDTHNGAFNGW